MVIFAKTMNIPLFIARRYLFSKKSQSVINIISAISMIGVGLITLAMIVVLSAFNGLEDLIVSMYSSFDPEIKITAVAGKTFSNSDIEKKKILEIDGIQAYSEVLQESVLLKFNDRQSIATLKGVDQEFVKICGLDTLIVEGELTFENNGVQQAVMGYGISYFLNLFVEDNFVPITVYAPKRGLNISMNPDQAFNTKQVMPAGIFSINPEFDNEYILTSLGFAKELLNRDTERSAIEIGLNPDVNPQVVKEKIEAVVGTSFEVKTRYELNELIFKTTKTEKWITYLIIGFILIIATFNIIGTLTMLIIDKKQDIYTMKSLGMCKIDIKKIFLFEGLLITFFGGVIGLVLGLLLCIGQQTFGWVALQGILIDHYPVELRWLDTVSVLLTLLVIGGVTSWFPARYVVNKYA